MTWTTWIILYCAVHVAVFLLIKHKFLAMHYEFEQRCKDVFAGKKDPWGLTVEQARQYQPFLRTDLRNIHVIWSFPYYITFLPRIILAWSLVFTLSINTVIMSIGVKEFRTFTGSRRDWMRFVLKQGCGLICLLLGFSFESEKATFADYSEYLGPDWKPEWDRPVTVIGNHVSFMDILFAIYWKFPVFVAASRARNVPGVGAVTDCLETIYYERLGDNAKESRKQVMEKIGDYQRQLAAGKAKNSLIIFPEACTTNGKQMISFRRGAFNALCDVQPYLWDYQDCGINPEAIIVDPTIAAFLLCCVPPTSVAKHTLLPIFSPNEFFWEHHWKPNQEKETKVDTYMRVVRQIMLKYSGLKDAGHVNYFERFDCIRAMTKKKDLVSE